jgi:c-di-GMP-binding flagellar brake protein YcgR
MHQQQGKMERRKYRRFPLLVGSFSVVRCDSGEIMGELTDISSGGMAFLTDPDDPPMLECARVDVLQYSNGVHLNSIPVRHVSKTMGDFEINRQRMKMARNSFGFQTLDSDQKKELGVFIRNHARI